MAASDDALQTIEPPAAKPDPLDPSAQDEVLKAVPPAQPAPTPEVKLKDTPPSAPQIKPAGAPPSPAPTTAQPSAPPAVPGPITPALVVQAGFPQDEAADWASLANWMTKGEAHSFNTLYGGAQFSDLSAHPADRGWSGGIGPDGQPTSAAGIFQDQKGTWHIIQQKYGLRDFSAVSQVSGNLRYAADLYQARTGRSLLADYKAGNLTSIASTLHDQWTSLGGAAPAGGAGDPVFDQYVKLQKEGYERIGKQAQQLIDAAMKEAPGSAERHELLRRAMERSDELARKFEKMSEKPPQPMSPFEAAGAMTPLLIALVSFAGGLSRRPALGAINALGSALGALKQGNDENYKNAVDLWSKQTTLARQAFGMQNDEIEAIMKDIGLSERERQDRLQNAFRALGLENDLEMAKANLWEKVYKRQDDRRKLDADIAEKHALTELHLQQAAKDAALAKLGGSTSPVAIEYTKGVAAFVDVNHRQPTPEEDKKIMDDAIAKQHPGAGRQGTEQGYIDDALKAKADELGVPVDQLSAADRHETERKAHQEWAQAGATGRTAGSAAGQLQSHIEDAMKAANEKAGRAPDLTPEQKVQADREAATFRHQAGISGNRKADIQNQVDQLGYGLIKLNEVFKLMDEHKMIAGIGGKLTSPGETILNILGSDETARGDFNTAIGYLKLIAPRILANTTARPLRSEAEQIDVIVRGLKLGDTTARTYSSLQKLQQLFTDMRTQHLRQLTTEWTPMNVPTAPTSPYTGAPAAPTAGGGGAVGVPPAGPATVAAPGFEGYDAR